MASSLKNPRASHPMCMCCRVCNMWCWRAFKWLPVLLIMSIIVWSYYAYVIQLCILTVENTVQKCIYLIVYHFLLIMFFWSYCQTIFAVIQPIPDKYKLPEAELEKLLTADSEDAQRSIIENFSKDLPLVTRLIALVRTFSMKIGYKFAKKETRKDIIEHHGNKVHVLTRTPSGSVRYCNRCVLIKPDRAHHCSICARCVLKMDHHCPWVNNCVCYFNYKYFMLFLGYALVYCVFIMATTLPYFVKFWRKVIPITTIPPIPTIPPLPIVPFIRGEFGIGQNVGTYHVLFAFFVALMFAVSLGSLFGYHCFLVANNRTTLDVIFERFQCDAVTGNIVSHILQTLYNEAFRAPMFRGGADKNGFSLGYYNNFKEVFGNVPQLWFIPVFTSLGDGCSYPVRREHQLQTFTTPQEPHGYESMGTTRSSFGDGIVYPLPDQEEDTESLLSSERWERWGERARPFDERESSSYDEL